MEITYEALEKMGFRRLDRQERQPHDSMMRCIALETTGNNFMVAQGDLCILLSPSLIPGDGWCCWIAKAHSFQRHPYCWIHVRTLKTTREVEFLYEALTGRAFALPDWDWKKLGEPLF